MPAETKPNLHLIDDLRQFLTETDGRSVAAMKAADEDFDDYVIKEVTADKDGTGWTVLTTDGTCFSFGRREGCPEPTPGSQARVYSRTGFPFYGIDIDGQEVFWQTPYQRLAGRVAWLADHDAKNRRRIDEGAEKRAANLASLPEPLRARIDAFAAADPEFWMDGDYELFCCTEAAKIAAYLRPKVDAGGDPAEVVSAFYDDRDQQAEAKINKSHSGNTFGGACALARAVLSGESVTPVSPEDTDE